jgi:hypothetical protein
LLSQIALFVHGLVDMTTWGIARPVSMFWVLWGMVMAVWNVYGSVPKSKEGVLE